MCTNQPKVDDVAAVVVVAGVVVEDNWNLKTLGREVAWLRVGGVRAGIHSLLPLAETWLTSAGPSWLRWWALAWGREGTFPFGLKVRK